MSFSNFRAFLGTLGGARARPAFWLVLAALPACEPELCGQRCGSDGGCPSGYVCGRDGLYCSSVAHPDACVLPLAAGAPEPAPSSPSSPPASPSGLVAPAPASPRGLLIGAGAGLREVCQGDEFAMEFHVQAEPGRAYEWSLLEAPPGLVLTNPRGADVQLSGPPSRAGTYSWVLLVTDDTGAAGRLPLSLVVHERPRILAAELPSICPGEIYRAPLLAEGGSGMYAWNTSLAERTGLSVAGGELGGRYSGSEAPGALGVELALRDEFCEVKARVSLEILSAGTEHCPAIEAAEGELPSQLPAPCLGNDYQAHLAVRQANTVPSYQWQPVQVPPGLQFDPVTASVSGRALGAGELVVQLTDAEPRRIEAHFPVAPRSQCWFGYVAGGSGARRLQLLDARLSYLAAARRSLPQAAAPAASVLDFAFSPRGRFLAYRLQTADTAQLWLLNLHTWQEQPLEVGGSVTRYVWGPAGVESDASWLAVGWSLAGEDRLGAVSLDLVPADALDGAVAPGISGLSYANSTAAALLVAPLWLDASESASLVLSPTDSFERQLQVARYASSGVSLLPPHDEIGFSELARLQRGVAGVFVIDNDSGFHNYFPKDGARFSAHDRSAIISPSGRFVGRAHADQLQIFRATDPSWSDSATPWAALDGCSALLAWAEGRERIACARVVGDQQRLVFFDLLDPLQPQLSELPPVQGEYSYRSGEHVGQPRVFSHQADRFAFATDAATYVLKLDDGTPRIERTLDGGYLQAPAGALSFSPSGELLSLHAGANLFVWSMTLPPNYWARLPEAVDPPAACSEAFATAGGRWCGLPPPSPVLLWSDAGDLFVYRSAAGNLEIEDVSVDFSERPNSVHVDLSCGAGCTQAEGYAFQP